MPKFFCWRCVCLRQRRPVDEEDDRKEWRRKSVRLREGEFMHGELQIDVQEARNLPDTDQFLCNVKRCFGQEKDVTDPYVAVFLDNTRIITTSVRASIRFDGVPDIFTRRKKDFSSPRLSHFPPFCGEKRALVTVLALVGNKREAVAGQRTFGWAERGKRSASSSRGRRRRGRNERAVRRGVPLGVALSDVGLACVRACVPPRPHRRPPPLPPRKNKRAASEAAAAAAAAPKRKAARNILLAKWGFLTLLFHPFLPLPGEGLVIGGKTDG